VPVREKTWVKSRDQAGRPEKIKDKAGRQSFEIPAISMKRCRPSRKKGQGETYEGTETMGRGGEQAYAGENREGKEKKETGQKIEAPWWGIIKRRKGEGEDRGQKRARNPTRGEEHRTSKKAKESLRTETEGKDEYRRFLLPL